MNILLPAIVVAIILYVDVSSRNPKKALGVYDSSYFDSDYPQQENANTNMSPKLGETLSQTFSHSKDLNAHTGGHKIHITPIKINDAFRKKNNCC